MPREQKRQRIAAYGVCRDGHGRLLLCRAAPYLTLRGRWFLPGGGVDHGEEPPDSLRREVEEETGLRVKVGPLLDVLSDVRRVPENIRLHTVRLIYRVDTWEGELRPERDGTTDAADWFTLEQLRSTPLAHYVEKVLARGL